MHHLLSCPIRHATFAALAVAAAVVLGGCAGCEGRIQTSGDDTGGDAGPIDAAVDGGGSGDTDQGGESDGGEMLADGESCPASKICGRNCCTGNTSCVKGQCLPACSGTRCGKQSKKCCTGSDVCLYDKCLTPGNDCSSNRNCPDGKICESTLKKCVPDPGIDCTYKPGKKVFQPEVEMAWKESDQTPAPEYKQVMMTPSVVDIDGSGTPDIIFSTFKGGAYNSGSVLRAIDGKTFDPVFHLTDASKRVAGSATVAVGDIDNDQKNEMVGVRPGNKGLVAIDDHTTGWKVMWNATGFSMNWDSASLVDLNADGKVEVVGANRVIAGATGKTLCSGQGVSGSPQNSTAVDLDGDGEQEVVGANGAFEFKADGSGGFTCPNMYTHSPGGYPAVGDFGTFGGGAEEFGNTDGKPEIAVVSGGSGGTVTLRNGQNGQQIWRSSIPSSGHPHFSTQKCRESGAGPPTVADFDGDDAPEVATAGACFYAVFDTDGSVLWKHPSQDFSSRQTGSSVFDFQGDGQAEAVYADECFIRVYKGKGNGDGTTDVLFKRSHTSGTTRELPVIVDVDGDFNTEIVLISNDYSGVGDQCSQNWPKFDDLGGEERGILVIEDEKNRWVSSRTIWNQHAYHVTNVCDGRNDKLCPGKKNVPGAIPKPQEDNWTIDHLNNFRQNVQGEGIFDAPDLLVTDIAVSNARCNDDDGLTVDLNVEISNRGARAVPAGSKATIDVSAGGGAPTRIGTVKTTKRLLPGQSERVTHTWTVPDNYATGKVTVEATADSDEQVNECKEGNNAESSEFRDLSSLAATLEFVSYEVDTSQCRKTGEVDVTLTLKNPGSNVVPKGVPVVVDAEGGGTTHEFGTVTTPKKMGPDESVTIEKSWRVPTKLVNQEIEVTVRIDPEQTVFDCGGGTETQKATCRLGG